MGRFARRSKPSIWTGLGPVEGRRAGLLMFGCDGCCGMVSYEVERVVGHRSARVIASAMKALYFRRVQLRRRTRRS